MKKLQIVFVFLIIPWLVMSQEISTDSIVKEKPERPAFESSFLIDNPTNVLFNKNTLEIQMAHRFGEFGNTNDLGGIWGASNIRIGVTYGVHERLTVGFGTTKSKRYQDFNWKVALFRQTRSEKMPVSVTYYGNFVIDARSKNQGLFRNTSDRYSYFNQLIIARRFNSKLSVQVAPSVSHYNTVERTMRNDMIAIAVGGRYKISSGTAIIADYSQPLSEFMQNNPDPGISFGVEFGTSSHTFQIFVTNLWGIVPQENYMFNQKNTGLDKDQGNGQYLIGFNITRNYNF
ncbi:MAG: hypothetical protein KJO49_10795 [Bacteroidia bacterium]|nr:hypothetical protein [Bacteroidia bacterium]MBT8268550.1 hypothetical protein [Bacteroidia bacterium]NNF82978.1 hypothetical protein [Flavobacteriaceae bacterium]NNK69577.1 hypothetical protein [Flavobacteriaceae bacterium]NNL80928.1 hypothetical protein [Flavobacteriaceae bacterium]